MRILRHLGARVLPRRASGASTLRHKATRFAGGCAALARIPPQLSIMPPHRRPRHFTPERFTADVRAAQSDLTSASALAGGRRNGRSEYN